MKAITFPAALFSVSFLFCNPTNPTVVSGNVTFDNPDSTTLNITSTSDRAIVNWEGFSNEFNEMTQITLPQSSSAILNRVTGDALSSLKGTLNCNGQVYLINPNGILITPSGRINVGSLVCSTLDTDNASFLAGGLMTFTGTSTAAITNMGQIITNTGDAILIGYLVDSSAPIYAGSGTAALGAGLEVILTPVGDQRISIVPSQHSVGDGGVRNSHYITALKTELRADGNIYSLAINQTGYITTIGNGTTPASAILEAPGGTTNCGGTIIALNSDQTGGTIEVLGQEVTVSGTLNVTGNNSDDTLNTAGNDGGGTIFVGGSPEGNDPSILSANNTTITPSARLYASAIKQGDGGTVSLFANENIDFGGIIASTGGIASGDGGTVYVWAVESLNNHGFINVKAYRGMNGQVIFHPSLAGVNE